MSKQAARPASPPFSALKGEIQSTTIPCLFHDLWVRTATGVLACTEQGATKKVQIAEGRVLFASSSDRDDRLNQVLLKAGAVSLRNLLKALEVSLASKDRLGEVLVRWKMASQAEVDACVRLQVTEIIMSLFHWTHGQFTFEPAEPDLERVTIGVPGDVVMVEGVRRIGSWGRVYEQVGGINAEYLATNGAEEIVKRLLLKPEERALLAACAEPMALGEMCDTSKQSNYEVCKSVWVLLLVGALMRA
jgi:hypothetical protein